VFTVVVSKTTRENSGDDRLYLAIVNTAGHPLLEVQAGRNLRRSPYMEKHHFGMVLMIILVIVNWLCSNFVAHDHLEMILHWNSPLCGGVWLRSATGVPH
jgi:hypothetical protein